MNFPCRSLPALRSNILSKIPNFGSVSKHHSTLPQVQHVQRLESADIKHFREKYFLTELPVFLPKDAFPFTELPGLRKWFRHSDTNRGVDTLNLKYLNGFAETLVPVELTKSTTDWDGPDTFERLTAPLGLFLRWVEQMMAEDGGKDTTTRLYLAQASLSDLPAKLQEDFPTPSLILEAGRGDVYNVNLWIGIAPTYTPLHRDPNPNLFLQLAGRKTVRLLRPELGASVFQEVQLQLAAMGMHTSSPELRGEEMMKGPEEKLLKEVVWRHHSLPCELYELHLEPGDALFIPKGWWHSIRGCGEGVVGSINWWFR